MDVGLSIRLTADVQQALRSFTQLTDATAELAVEGKGNLTAVSLALKDLKAAQSDVGNVEDLRILNRAIKDLSSEASNLRKEGTQAIKEVGQAAPGAAQSIDKVTESTEKSGTSFSKLYGYVRQLAYVLPGIGIGGIFALAGTAALSAAQSMGLFEDGLFKTTDAEKHAAEATKELAKALVDLKSPAEIQATATGSQEGQIAQVRALAAAAQDLTLSTDQRSNAVAKLHEINKAYFGDLTLEAGSLAGLTAKVNEYTQALYQQAIVKGAQDAISKTSQELFKQTQIYDDLKKKLDQATAAQEAYKKNPVIISTGQFGTPTDPQNDILTRKAEEASAAVDKEQKSIFTLNAALDQYRIQIQQATEEGLKFEPLKAETIKKGVDELQKEIDALEQTKRALTDLTKTGTRPSFDIQNQLNAVNTQLLTDKIAKALRDGVKNGLSSDIVNQQVAALQAELDKIGTAKTVHIKTILVPVVEPDSNVVKEFEKGIGTAIPTIKWNVKIQAIVDYVKEFDQIKAQLTKRVKSLQDDLLSGIGQGIGNALAGKGNPFDSFLKILGSGLESIGKYVLSTIPLIAILQKALQNLGTINPVVLAVAGIGLVAIGAAIKSNVKATAFADGGVVTGPTYGLIGEAGPEAIFPLSKIGDFMKNIPGRSGDVNVSGDFRIQGNDLRLVLARSNKNSNLVSPS